jgi:signal transduction histidine kinase
MMNNVKEFEEKLKTATGKDRFDILQRLAISLFYSDPKRGKAYGIEALEIAEELGKKSSIAKAHQILGICNGQLGDFETAREESFMALHIYEEINNKKEMSDTLLNIGVFHTSQDEKLRGLEYLLKSLELKQEIEDDHGIAGIYHNMGIIYKERNEYDKALEYYENARNVYEKVDNLVGLGAIYNNIGLVYSEKENYEKSLEYYFRAIKIREEIGDKDGIASTYNNLGTAYKNLENYEKALEFLEKALELFEELGNKSYKAASLNNIGAIYLKLDDYDVAIDYLKEGVALSKAVNAKVWLKNGYEGIIEAYIGKGNYEKAFEYVTPLLELKDDIFDEQKSKQIADMQSKHETEKARREAEIQHLKNVELVEKNKLIEEQKEEIVLQNEHLMQTLEELERTQEQLVESKKMASLGNLVAGVAHEINTPVGIGITAVTSLIRKTEEFVSDYNADQISVDDLEDYLQKSYEISELMLRNLQRTANLIQSFKQVSVDQSTEQKRRFNLKNYLNDVIATLEPKLKHKKIAFDIQCDDDLEIESYPGDFAQIFTNLILNSLNHGFADKDSGEIRIGIQQKSENSRITLTYEDNGNGIPDDILPKIFDPFFTTNKQGGTGLGMHIVYNLITQKLNGEISCQSEEGRGVSFEIRV